MSDQPHDHAHDHHHQDRVYKAYWSVFLALCVCTGLSFLFNRLFGHGPLAATLISIVAIIKAALVISVFMHFKYDWRKIYGIMVPVCIMCVMFVIIICIDSALVWRAVEK